MRDFFEFDEILHKIREEIAEETKDMSVEERIARSNRIGSEFCEKYGLRMIESRDELRRVKAGISA